MFGGFDFGILWANAPFLWNGMLLTIELTALAVTGGLLFGVVLAVLRLSPFGPLAWLVEGYVNFLRSMPLILVIFWFYTLVPKLRKQLAHYPTFIAFYVGRSDPTFVPDNLKLNGALNSVGVQHVFDLYDGGHTATLWQTHATQWFGLALSHLTDAKAG